MMPFEPYGLSKQVGECIARMVARSTKTTVASLRFTNVVMPEDQSVFPLPAPTPEDPSTLVMWAYADPRDVAEAHVLALEADLRGHEAFLLAQPITRFREPTVELIRRNFGGRVEIRGTLDGSRRLGRFALWSRCISRRVGRFLSCRNHGDSCARASVSQAVIASCRSQESRHDGMADHGGGVPDGNVVERR